MSRKKVMQNEKGGEKNQPLIMYVQMHFCSTVEVFWSAVLENIKKERRTMYSPTMDSTQKHHYTYMPDFIPM